VIGVISDAQPTELQAVAIMAGVPIKFVNFRHSRSRATDYNAIIGKTICDQHAEKNACLSSQSAYTSAETEGEQEETSQKITHGDS